MFHSFHFTIILVCYSVDSHLSETHTYISIAISGGLAPFFKIIFWLDHNDQFDKQWMQNNPIM